MKKLMFVTKHAFYLFIVQLIGLNALLANPVAGKGLEKIFISISAQELHLTDFFIEIESKTNLSFLYDDHVLDNSKTFSCNEKNASVEELLLEVSKETGLAFRQINQNVFVTRRRDVKEENFQQEQRTITGTVTDAANGEPLIGASIVVKGTARGTVTNVSGYFSLELPAEVNTIVVSYLGYMRKELVLNESSSYNIALSPDAAALDEVMVIGYSQVERKDLTGSVSSMNTDIIREANKVDAVQSLQGRMPGVDIQSTGNKPGSSFNIRIRGNNTINNTESVNGGGYNPGQNPLFVVDGVFVDDISYINPADIERVDVLKDASATAIYGSRGSAGVVIVSTKQGGKGPLKVEYDNYIGVRQAYNLPDIFNGPEFVQFMKDAVVGTHYASGDFSIEPDDVNLADYLRPNELENIEKGKYVNWPELIKQNGFQMNHSLGLSGGTDKAVYGFGVAYTRDEGTFPGEDLERYNIRANVNVDVSPFLSLGYNGYVTYSTVDQGSMEGFRSAYRLRPTGDAYDENGDPLFFPIKDETFITNPLFEESGIIEETKTLNYFGNFIGTFNLLEELKFTTTFSPNLTFSRYGQFRGKYTKSSAGLDKNRRAYADNSNQLSYSWDNMLNFDKKLGGHHLSADLIMSSWLDRNELYQSQVRNFNSDSFLFYNIGSAADIRTLRSSLSKESLLSYTGRFNYTLNDRYLLTMTGRYDGASKLAAGNKWAFFPSAALAWRISEEPFMQNLTAVSNFKVRLSYGITGNTGTGGGLRPLGSQSNIAFGFTNLDDQPVQTAYVTNLANEELTWEKTSEVNLGLDYGFLKNRINGAVELYSRKTTDLIIERALPIVSGYGSVFQNVGEVENKGIELTLNTAVIQQDNFQWNISLNFAKNINELTELYAGLDELPSFSTGQAGSFIHRVGEPVGSIFTYQYDGIWQLDEVEEARKYGQEPGQVKVKDIDNNGVIDDEDRVITGSLQPDWTGGISTSVSYRNLDFSVFAFTRQGVKSVSGFHVSHAWDGDNAPARFNGLKTNYWTPENTSNDWHQPGNGGPYAGVLNYRDVSFTKIGYLTLGYKLPQSWLAGSGISGIRIYATAQNPFIFTSYEGWDPETAGRNTYRSAFLSRTFIGGVNIKF